MGKVPYFCLLASVVGANSLRAELGKMGVTAGERWRINDAAWNRLGGTAARSSRAFSRHTQRTRNLHACTHPHTKPFRLAMLVVKRARRANAILPPSELTLPGLLNSACGALHASGPKTDGYQAGFWQVMAPEGDSI